jgi:hypothetical protein
MRNMRRKTPLAAVAAVTAAIAVAVLPANASAQTFPFPITIPPQVCDALQQQAQAWNAAGFSAVGDLITEIAKDIGCTGGGGQ